jgi:sulfatase maturation enzyme AslB (radical SAM superfamily)
MKMAPGFSEVYISGGEPMLMKKLIGFLEQLSPDCLVAMNTNMSIYNENFITQLKRFNNICIGASIDGVGARFDFLRQNASFATVAENFSRLRDDLPQAQLEFNFTLSCFNADQLLPTYEFIKNFVQSRGDMRLVITQVSDTAHLSPFNIPLEKRRRLASDLQLFMDANIPLLEQTFSKGYLKNAIELLNLDSPLPEREPALTYLKFLNNNRSIQREVYQDILGLLTNAAPNVHEHVAQLES